MWKVDRMAAITMLFATALVGAAPALRVGPTGTPADPCGCITSGAGHAPAADGSRGSA